MIDNKITETVYNLVKEVSENGDLTHEDVLNKIYNDKSLTEYQKTCVGFLMGFISGKTR